MVIINLRGSARRRGSGEARGVPKAREDGRMALNTQDAKRKRPERDDAKQLRLGGEKSRDEQIDVGWHRPGAR